MTLDVNQMKQMVEEGDWDTALIMAAKGEHLEVMKYLIQECGADPSIEDTDGWGPLHHAIFFNKKNMDCIKLLLEGGLPLEHINRQTYPDNWTAIDLIWDSEAWWNDNSIRSHEQARLIKKEIDKLLRLHGGLALRDIDPRQAEYNILGY